MSFLLRIMIATSMLLSGTCLAQSNSTVTAAGSTGLPEPTDGGPIQRFYSSTFVNPKPPKIVTEFRANYMQHKFDVNVNNIVTGFIYISPTQRKIRADGAADGTLEVSIFDFTNTTANGTLVANSILSFSGGATNPTCSSFFVSPFVQLFPDDFLAQSNAVFAGIQHDDLYGAVTAWTFSMGNDLQVTFFLDSTDTFVRFDFAASNPLRTFATTRFFNIIPETINSTVFDTPCNM